MNLKLKNKIKKIKFTLHIGATKTAPSQYSGFFLWTSNNPAPPIDSPNKNLIFFLFSFFSAIFSLKKKTKQITFLYAYIIYEEKLKFHNYHKYQWSNWNNHQQHYWNLRYSPATLKTCHALHNLCHKLHTLLSPIGLQYLDFIPYIIMFPFIYTYNLYACMYVLTVHGDTAFHGITMADKD